MGWGEVVVASALSRAGAEAEAVTEAVTEAEAEAGAVTEAAAVPSSAPLALTDTRLRDHPTAVRS